MHDKFLSAVLIFVGVIHILPMVGLLGIKRLSMLYAISITDPNVEILIRHRAVLFGLLGSFLIYSAFHVHLYGFALAAAFFSLISFVWLALAVGGYNSRIRKVLAVDLVALVVVLIAAVLFFRGPGVA